MVPLDQMNAGVTINLNVSGDLKADERTLPTTLQRHGVRVRTARGLWILMLTFRSVDLQDDEDPRLASVYFDLRSGYSEPAEARGEDDVIPGLAGQYPRNRISHRRIIILNGFIRGMGGTDTERTLAWRAATDTIMAVFDPALDPGELEISGGYLGITGATIQARATDVIGGEVISRQFQRWSVELLAVDPVDWAGS